jgi:hypothetical protein
MNEGWDNKARFDSINIALSMVPHDQTAIGLGFRLRHDPTKCPRCRATIALLELGGILQSFESYYLATDEEVEIDA